MSLISYLNTGNSSSTSSSTATASSSVYASALAKLTEAKASLDAGTTGGSATGVSISAAATIAAATKADAKKEPATLVAELRQTLDAHYETTGRSKADLSALSPRSVATIALNQTGAFTKAEVLTAKAEMRARDRAAFFETTANDFSLSSLETYQSARRVGYTSMSVEERALRGNKG